MTDPIDAILQDFQAGIEQAMFAMSRLRMMIDSNNAKADDRLDLINVGAAGKIAGVTDDRIRQLCRENLYGSSNDGFGYKLGGRWQVVEKPFRRFLGLKYAAVTFPSSNLEKNIS